VTNQATIGAYLEQCGWNSTCTEYFVPTLVIMN